MMRDPRKRSDGAGGGEAGLAVRYHLVQGISSLQGGRVRNPRKRSDGAGGGEAGLAVRYHLVQGISSLQGVPLHQ
jgi:hypothetical protein